ncbi:MAG: rod shape-determining protein RodA [Victivallaceae bacterium]|nr:rod shape-determining protein RodA [Victivallaceae bacterium]
MAFLQQKTTYHDSFLRRVFNYLKEYDFLQIGAFSALFAIGVIFIYSTGIQVGTPTAAEAWIKQIQWITVSLLAWALFAVIDYRQLRPLTVIFYIFSGLLLVAVLVFGAKINGAQRWLVFRPVGLRLQPSELAKLSVILFLSSLLSTHGFNVNKPRNLFYLGLAVLLPFLLIAKEPDLGSSVILLPLSGLIVFAAGLRWRYIITAAVFILLVLGAEIANEVYRIHPLLKTYQKERVLTFLDPERDLNNRGYNQFQARLAVGSGGINGKGIGQGTQNALGFLPQSVSNNDFIFSVIAEETGFIGCSVLIGFYLLLLYSLLRTAFSTPDHFGRYIAVGMAGMFFAHSFINMGMSAGLTPVTGLSLPFVSYGGSFIISAMCGLGICQSVYRHRHRI